MATKAAKARPLGDLTDQLWAMREEKRAINEQLKEVEARIEATQSELIERMEAEGLDSMKGKKASLTVSASLNPQIEDWDKFLAWTWKTKNLQLLRRQINPDPWRECMGLRKPNDPVPGTVPFIKKTLNMRTI